MCEVLESDHLNVRNEELVFDAVCRWIDFDPERRRSHMARLLKTIRLGLLTTQFFVEKVGLRHAPSRNFTHWFTTAIFSYATGS